MTTGAEWEAASRHPTFSFYLTAPACKKNPAVAFAAAGLADALTIAGHNAPEVAKQLRDSGLEIPLLIDGMGYKFENLPKPEKWVEQQSRVGAARLLLPGVFIPWERDSEAAFVGIIKEQGRVAKDLGAMILAAADVRWVARKTDWVVDSLLSTGQPVALILADRGDPLSVGGAVIGLQRLASQIVLLFLLRSDHGSIGALAYGANHASIGLTTSTRHYAHSSSGAWRNPGSSARLFVRPYLDWFLAHVVAGWTAAGSSLLCPLPCCGGGSLSRYLDDDFDATWHNMNALAEFASHIVAAEPADRRAEFLNACRHAASQYGLAGFQGPEDPKAQLTSWSFS